MKIGYPCVNRSLDCTPSRTFRLASYNDDRFKETVSQNLECLDKVLDFNIEQQILFFRLSSALVPFASHPVCTFPWTEYFKPQFRAIGRKIRSHSMRISMHPDQFVLINSPDPGIVARSIEELMYHARVLDLMELDKTAKIQIHTGGVYGDKSLSIDRFCKAYNTLPNAVLRRLVIENDDRLYNVDDCMAIHSRTGIPVLFDSFHHEVLNKRETVETALDRCKSTWKRSDGIIMVDYSSQKKGARPGAHTEAIDLRNFRKFLVETRDCDFDCMLEIKDKEKSAVKAIQAARDVLPERFA